MKNLAIIVAAFFLISAVAIYFNKDYQYSEYALEKKVDRIKQYKVNLNLANWREFDNLPGVGPQLAHEIINDRETNGRFNSVSEIKRVKGIGSKKFKEMEEYLTMEVQ